MQYKQFFILLIYLLLPTTWVGAVGTNISDGYSSITINEAKVQGVPKSSYIQASIDGHTLTVVFSEGLGEVVVEVTDSNGGLVDLVGFWPPDSYVAYIFATGSYVVTFTLSNGDEYYGEFEVTD